MRVNRGGKAHCHRLDAVAFIMRANLAQGGLAQSAIEQPDILAGALAVALAQRCGDPPHQAMMQLTRQITPSLRLARRRGAPAAFSTQHRHRPAGNQAVRALREARQQARAIRFVGGLYRQRLAQKIHPYPADQFPHDVAITHQAGRCQPVEHRHVIDDQRPRQFGLATTGEGARGVLAQGGFHRAGRPGNRRCQRRTRAIVEPVILGQEKIVDRDHQPMIGARDRGRRTREQPMDVLADVVLRVAAVDRHTQRSRQVSLKRD